MNPYAVGLLKQFGMGRFSLIFGKARIFM